MPEASRRRGIERRILTSIVWVGIVPMALAILIGYFGARSLVKRDIEAKLFSAVAQTADGLHLAETARLRTVASLAHADSVLAALHPDDAGRPTVVSDPGVEERVTNRLQAELAGVDEASISFSLYDANGDRVLLVGPELEGGLEDGMIPLEMSLAADEPAAVGYDVVGGRYFALMAAPVRGPDGVLHGYVAKTDDITPLLKFAFGLHPYEDAAPRTDIQFFLVHRIDLLQRAVYWRSPDEEDLLGDPPPSGVVYARLDPALASLFADEDRPPRDRLLLRDARIAQVRSNWFLAYSELLNRPDTLVVGYQSASNLYGTINLWAMVVALVSVGIIGLFCLNAYRSVHNNIVRPVSLLNEGAQIIGQGDLDLKLKIDTGDEIEELALSFNKMALALKNNIQELGKSEERYRSLITSMRDGILQSDPEGIIAFVNPAGVEIFGARHAAEVIGVSLRHHFVSQEDVTAAWNELHAQRFIERSRVWMRRLDGREICVELSANLVTTPDGAIRGIEGIFRDVTTSVQLEQEARERSERISAINQIANVINSSLESGRLYESFVVEIKRLVNFDFAALALLDESGESFERRRLWPRFEATATERWKVGDESSCAGWVARHKQTLLNQDIEADDAFRGQFPEGMRSCISIPLYATARIIGTLDLASAKPKAYTRHDVEVMEQMAPHVAVAIRNAQLLDNLQHSLEEVTKAREKLHEANEELKTLDEMKTNLLSNVSHELRTPLVSVMGYTDMIINEKAGPVTDTQRDYLTISLRNIDRLVTLIENLLDFSRLHRGVENIVFDTFDLRDCARASVQLMQPVAEAREIELEYDPPADPILIEGDKGKLGQVFNNLLSNAVKFNHPEGRVTISLHMHDGNVEVSVSDTGIGIPPEAQDKVFSRFYQYDSSSTRKYGGTGIGLAIAQDIARLHGSRITVQSVPGEGSTFQFNLPLSEKMRGSDGEAVVVPAEDTERVIQLISHDRALVGQFRAVLEGEGMEVLSASSAERAIELASRHSPDCIVVDVDTTPGETAVLDALLEEPRTRALPIVLLSNDQALHERYAGRVASRVKRGFRKSTLLSGIHYAMSVDKDTAPPLGGKVLAVDDDEEILTFIDRCLAPEGIEVDACASGDEALEALARQEHALVLLDIAMPGIDGYETCRRIKADPALRGAKVYLVTAKPVDSASARYRESGADGYLQKPFRADELIDLVRSHDHLLTIARKA